MTRERQSLNATSERDKEIGLDRRTAGRTEKNLQWQLSQEFCYNVNVKRNAC